MKSTNLFFIGALLMLLCSCSEKNEILKDPDSTQANITFVAQVGKAMSAETRSSAPSKLDEKQFVLYAFKKSDTEDKYSFQKVGDTKVTTEIKDGKWQYGATLPVGVYKFIAFYNLDGTNKTSVDVAIEAMKNLTWNGVLAGIAINHSAGTEDMNEIFYSESGETSYNISSGIPSGSGNSINIELTLKRLTSRFDIKFIKVAADNKDIEVPYSNSASIFGAKNALTTLSLNLSGVAESYTLSGNNSTKFINCNKIYEGLEEEALNPLLNYGTATAETINAPSYAPFPKTEGAFTDVNMIKLLHDGISNGGAYFMGSYLLPLIDDDKKINAIITLSGANNAEREIKNIINLKSTKNYVTVITVKLVSSTKSDENGKGDDNENLFNPKSGFTVEVDYRYDGLNRSEVEVE